MALITLEEAKSYLRVDTAEEDGLIAILLGFAGRMCADVARLSDARWDAVDGGAGGDLYTEDELRRVRDTMRAAVLYALAYVYEHREEADHHALLLTLRAMLFSIREGVV